MRKYLAKIDWNNTLKNKTATECWNILKSEIDCIVDKCVPLKQGKRSKKKHLSKEAIRKIKYKQIMWKSYKHTGSEEDYAIYKETPHQATAEVQNSKRSYEQKIVFNKTKYDSKRFYAYVRSKQKLQDKVGLLEGSGGNIITEGFLMAEKINDYFCSVFTREDISALPVLETTYKEKETI